MTYLYLAAFGVSFFALLWMAKLLGQADAYKQAFLIVFLGTLGWCMPIFIQIFVLATFLTICAQYWEDVKPAFITWVVAVLAMFAIGHAAGGTTDMVRDLIQREEASETTPSAPATEEAEETEEAAD